MTLKDDALNDVENVFLNNDEHAEPVQFCESKDGHKWDDYTMIVDRGDMIGVSAGQDGTVYRPDVMVYMAQDGTNGPLTCKEGYLLRISKTSPVTTFPTNECDYATWKVVAIEGEDSFGLRAVRFAMLTRREVTGEGYRLKRGLGN